MRRSTPLPSLACLCLGEDTKAYLIPGTFRAGEVGPGSLETWDRLSTQNCDICGEPVTQIPVGMELRGRDPPWALNCGHVYHLHCLEDWIATPRPPNENATCPVCRRAIIPEPEPPVIVQAWVLPVDDREDQEEPQAADAQEEDREDEAGAADHDEVYGEDHPRFQQFVENVERLRISRILALESIAPLLGLTGDMLYATFNDTAQMLQSVQNATSAPRSVIEERETETRNIQQEWEQIRARAQSARQRVTADPP